MVSGLHFSQWCWGSIILGTKTDEIMNTENILIHHVMQCEQPLTGNSSVFQHDNDPGRPKL